MAPLDYSTIITESEEALGVLLRKAHKPLIRRRLRFLILLRNTPGISRAKAGRNSASNPEAAKKYGSSIKKAALTWSAITRSKAENPH